jgi:hypothetical protein
MLKRSIENMGKLVVFGFSRRPGAARLPFFRLINTTNGVFGTQGHRPPPCLP